MGQKDPQGEETEKKSWSFLDGALTEEELVALWGRIPYVSFPLS